VIRRMNYTKRKFIHQQDVSISLDEATKGLNTFDVILHLSKYELPSDASVFIEAYRQTSWMRFNYGTVGAISAPDNRSLTEFDSTEGILFRVRVTSTDSPHGLLLAEADKISLRSSKEQVENRMPLLSVRPEDLGCSVYRVDFADRPILTINSAVGDWKAVSRSTEFSTLVYAAVFREILVRIMGVEKYFETEDLLDWRSQWLSLALSLPGTPDLPKEDGNIDDLYEWIDQTIGAFSKQHSIMQKFNSFWTGVTDK